MFKERYRQMNERIVPPPQLVSRVKQMRRAESKGKNGRRFIRKPIAAAVAAVICLFAVLPVMAGELPAIYELMYLVSPDIAQFFMPVQKSCEDNGIRMEVVSASIHGDTAEIYITLQDLEGDRIDATTDLNDSYSIRRAFDSSASCRRVGYDSASGKVTFLITITEWGSHKITGNKITFSLREFLSHKREYKDLPLEVDFSSVGKGTAMLQPNLTGGSGPAIEQFFPEHQTPLPARVLQPSAPMAFPVEGIDFTGIGYIDGKLHLQTAVTNNLEKDNHGYFFLKKQNGDEIRCDYHLSFLEYRDSGERIDYNEYVFDIPQTDISQYELYGYFVTCDTLTKGNWQVTFPLKNSELK